MPVLTPPRRTTGTAPTTLQRSKPPEGVRLTPDASVLRAGPGGRAATATATAGAAGAGAPGRDRHLDLLRAVAIVAVVVGHWLVVVPTFGADGFSGSNALEQVGSMRGLTWFFQVMPLFFVVGGVANARSWRSAKGRGEGYGVWLNTRLRRLAEPSLWLFGVGAVLAVGLRAAGVDPGQVHLLAWLVTVPVWFLAVYVFVIAGAPLMLKAHDKFGPWVLPTLLARVVFVDVMRFRSGVSVLTYSNFLWVFLFCQQLGFLWLDGKVPSNRFRQASLALGGVGAMTLLVAFGPYPLSLVGVPGEAVQNNAPPTLMLLVAGVVQLSVALLLRPLCVGLPQRRRVWAAVIGLNAHAMTILLWHFTALVVASAVVLPLGIIPSTLPGSLPWWLVRAAMLVLYLVPLVGLVWGFGRIERRALLGDGRPVRSLPSTVSTAAGGLSFAAGCAAVTVGGLSDQGSPLGVPVVAVLPLAGGWLLIWGFGRRRRNADAQTQLLPRPPTRGDSTRQGRMRGEVRGWVNEELSVDSINRCSPDSCANPEVGRASRRPASPLAASSSSSSTNGASGPSC